LAAATALLVLCRLHACCRVTAARARGAVDLHAASGSAPTLLKAAHSSSTHRAAAAAGGALLLPFPRSGGATSSTWQRWARFRRLTL
jgi:hypothetical protein